MKNASMGLHAYVSNWDSQLEYLIVFIRNKFMISWYTPLCSLINVICNLTVFVEKAVNKTDSYRNLTFHPNRNWPSHALTRGLKSLLFHLNVLLTILIQLVISKGWLQNTPYSRTAHSAIIWSAYIILFQRSVSAANYF